MKVIVPVGLRPPASVAVSVKVTALAPSVTVVGSGAVVSVVPAAGTATGSSKEPLDTASLFESPL